MVGIRKEIIRYIFRNFERKFIKIIDEYLRVFVRYLVIFDIWCAADSKGEESATY